MLEISQTVPKLKVNLRFIDGPQAGQIIEIDPTKTMTVFGAGQLQTKDKESSLELLTGIPDDEIQYCTLTGNRIVENHMAIYFDSLSCSLVLNNQNIDCEESCGVYRRLKKDEDFRISPDDAFRIGSLEFQV